jgi:hypothetical protein
MSTFDISDAQLLQLIGLREAELFVLRQRVQALERQLAMIAEAGAEQQHQAAAAAEPNGAVHE